MPPTGAVVVAPTIILTMCLIALWSVWGIIHSIALWIATGSLLYGVVNYEKDTKMREKRCK